MNLSLGLQHKVFSLLRSLLGQVIQSVGRDGQPGLAIFQDRSEKAQYVTSRANAMGAQRDSSVCATRLGGASLAPHSQSGSQRYGLRTRHAEAPKVTLDGDPRTPHSQSTSSMRCHRPAVPLRVLHEVDRSRPSGVGRMVISGRMADVCAELDRLAAMEVALQARLQVTPAG